MSTRICAVGADSSRRNPPQAHPVLSGDPPGPPQALDSIRKFVQSLLRHIDVLTPSEMFALAMQAGARMSSTIDRRPADPYALTKSF